jgi:hypothetical protein
LERVALRGCTKITTAGIYLLLQRRGLKRVVISKCPQVTLEGLCSESNLKVGRKRMRCWVVDRMQPRLWAAQVSGYRDNATAWLGGGLRYQAFC